MLKFYFKHISFGARVLQWLDLILIYTYDAKIEIYIMDEWYKYIEKELIIYFDDYNDRTKEGFYDDIILGLEIPSYFSEKIENIIMNDVKKENVLMEVKNDICTVINSVLSGIFGSNTYKMLNKEQLIKLTTEIVKEYIANNENI